MMHLDQDAPRKPLEQPPIFQDLAVLPVFFKLAGRRVVVAGGSAGAAWKARLLLACGARVDVFCAYPGEEMREVCTGSNAVGLQLRSWAIADFLHAAMAIGDFENEAEAVAFRCAAQAAGVPVNLVDRPRLCDFQFGSIVNRSPLVIGISTDGAAPVFGQAIRARIETLLPLAFQNWAAAALRWRPAVQSRGFSFRRRRAFWDWFTRRAFSNPNLLPDEAERDTQLDAVAGDDGLEAGSVTLVGAGPGDPELLTLKAVRLLQAADVVLYDDLIHPGVVEMARREARAIRVGKRGHKPSCAQTSINEMIVSFAQQGLKVVRLKGGDPMIFGRASEEIEACRQAGIQVEVVPGVTAACGAAAGLQMSLTHRNVARRLQFITCHATDGGLPQDLDWSALSDPAASTVVYMGLRTLPEFTAKLLLQGLAASTPVCLVERATREDEHVISGTLETIATQVAASSVQGPCLILIGEAFRQNANGPL